MATSDGRMLRHKTILERKKNEDKLAKKTGGKLGPNQGKALLSLSSAQGGEAEQDGINLAGLNKHTTKEVTDQTQRTDQQTIGAVNAKNNDNAAQNIPEQSIQEQLTAPNSVTLAPNPQTNKNMAVPPVGSNITNTKKC